MKKSVITLLIFLIMIISVSAVSAADDASDLGASDDATISVANTDTAVSADKDVKNFTELNTLITGDTTGELTLSSDYKYNGTESIKSIAFNHNIVIDGNGSTINGTGRVFDPSSITNDIPIFYIGNGLSVTLKNMKIVGFNNTAILNEGVLTLDNVTFDDPVMDNSGGVLSSGTLNVTNCIFNLENAIGLAGPNAILISPSVINITATIDDTDWRKIKYAARIYDENNNKVFIDDDVKTSIEIKIHGEGVTGATVLPDYNGVTGVADAKYYYENVVNATGGNVFRDVTVNTATVNVAPKDVDPNIDFKYTPANPVWNDTVVLTVTVGNYSETGINGNFTPTGTITFTIQGDTKQPIELVNGSANYTIENIGVGTCSILIDYSGDASFNAAYQIPQSFIVGKATPTITVNVTNSTVGQQVITIELPSDANGVINATIDGYAQYDQNNKQLVDGKYTFNTELPANDASAYTITVKYSPVNNDNYTVAQTTVNFWASRFTSDVIIEVENTTYGSNVSFTIKVAEGIKNATVTVGTYNEVVNFTNGVAKVDLGVIAADEYTITVDTIENSEYQACNNDTKFKVAAANPNIVITVGDYVLFEDVNVTVTVTNAKADGDIKLTINGVEFTTEHLDENGTAKFTITADKIHVGDNEIGAEFIAGNTNYTNNQTSKVINVAALTPTIIINVNRVNIGQNAVIEAIVNGSAVSGAPKPTGYVTILVGPTVIAQEILSDGKTTITIPKDKIPELGTYYFNATYVPDTADFNYTQVTTEFSVEVTKWDVEEVIDVRDFNVTEDEVIINVTAGVADPDQHAFVNNFTVTIKDANNNIINVTSIALVIGQKTPIAYNTTKLGPGDFTVEVSYDGDDYHYANATAPVEFSIKKVIENLTVVVENVNYPNQAVAVVNASVDGKYNVTVKGNKNYTVDVKDGIGNVTLDLLDYSADAYEVTVVSLIDGYATLTNTTTFNVNQGTINATITIENVVYGNNVTVVVKDATIDGVYNITEEGSTTPLANVTIKDGQGSVNFAINKNVGQYTFVLIAPANGNFTNSAGEVNKTKFNVTNATIHVSVNVDDVKYGDKILVVVTADLDEEYTIYINGTEQSARVKVVNGTGNQTYTLGAEFIPATYNVTANITVANYNPAGAKKHFQC